jgi:preprotein translocase subunit SecE
VSKAEASQDKENRIVKYLRETRAELRKVTWPTPDEARNLTVIVLIVTVVMSLFLGLLDVIFSGLISLIVG